MITQPRAILLAINALRLLKQQHESVLAQTYETSVGEVLEAVAFFQALKPKPQAQDLTPEEREIAGRFKRSIQQGLDAKIEYLARGNALDFSDYKRIVGEISGLRGALRTYDDIINTQDEIDNE